MRAASLVIVSLLLAAGPLANAQAPARLSVGARQPFAFLLGTPTGEGGRTSSSEVIRIVSDLLRDDTDLELDLLDAELMRTCRGRLACLTLKARRDYVRSALADPSGRPLPFREHVRQMRERGTPYPKYLFVLSNVTIKGQADRMSAVLVNTDLALAYYHAADRNTPDWEDAVEAKINAAAVVSPPARAELPGPEATRAFLAELFLERFVRAFESTGNWRPFGELALVGAPPDAVVYVDDQPIGATSGAVTLIDKVSPGRREVRVEHPDHLPFQAEARVRRGERAEVQVQLVAKPITTSALPRQLTLWTGVAMATAGIALTAYGATRSQTDLRTVCFEPTSCESGQRFVTFGYDPEASDPRQINPPGVMIVPLGYSLAGAGAAFSIGSLLSTDEELPWLGWVIGTAVGGLAYGVSAAVAGP